MFLRNVLLILILASVNPAHSQQDDSSVISHTIIGYNIGITPNFWSDTPIWLTVGKMHTSEDTLFLYCRENIIFNTENVPVGNSGKTKTVRTDYEFESAEACKQATKTLEKMMETKGTVLLQLDKKSFSVKSIQLVEIMPATTEAQAPSSENSGGYSVGYED